MSSPSADAHGTESNAAAREALLSAWQQEGQREALERLLALELAALKRSLRKSSHATRSGGTAGDVSDFAQSAVRRLLERGDGPRFADTARLRAYLKKTARNRLVEYRVRNRLQPAEAELFAAHSGGVGAVERREELRSVLPRLEPALREIVELQFLRGLSRREVCEHLGISKQTASERTLRALAALKQLLAR